MKFSTLVLLLVSFIQTNCYSQTTGIKQKNGMNVHYVVKKNYVEFTMSAPTSGWVAIGINSKNALKGSNFLIGRVRDGKAELSEFYTREPGDVPLIKDLNGPNAVSSVEGQEKDGTTRIKFNLERFPQSDFHHQLASGKTFYVHIAFSHEDDYAHHSAMRDLVEITF